MANNSCFFYFGFGSNLNKERIQLNSSSAELYGIAKLNNYRLTFGLNRYGPSKLWHGGTATIIPDAADHVWGAVWSINMEDLVNLDKQEGVSHAIYRPIEIDVTTVKGEMIKCRTYQLDMPQLVDADPSPQYLNVILSGARQIKLPSEYVQRLEKIKHNNYSGEIDYKTIKVDGI